MAKPCTSLKFQHAQSGFTLVELMIVVIVASILAAYAVPTYRDHALQGRIPEGTSSLSIWRLQMEQYYQDRHNYGDARACGVSLNASPHFTYSCESGSDGQSYLLTATGTPASGMGNFTFTLDQAGAAATSALPSGWGAVPVNCWVVKKSRGCP